jgi:hypothetical protein
MGCRGPKAFTHVLRHPRSAIAVRNDTRSPTMIAKGRRYPYDKIPISTSGHLTSKLPLEKSI